MSNRIIAISLLVFSSSCLFAQTNLEEKGSDVVNWGFKIGVNSMSNNNYQVFYNDNEILEKSVSNKVGYTASSFFRINIEKVFMQAEASISVSKESVDFKIPSETNPSGMGYSLKIDYNYVDLGVFPGYNIVKEKPFLLNVYVGPSVKYYYQTKYSPKYSHEFKDPTKFYNFNLTTGMSVNVSRFLMDFRYEINLQESNHEFSGLKDCPDPIKEISIKKNENTLRLSIGILF